LDITIRASSAAPEHTNIALLGNAATHVIFVSEIGIGADCWSFQVSLGAVTIGRISRGTKIATSLETQRAQFLSEKRVVNASMFLTASRTCLPDYTFIEKATASGAVFRDS
jgi:hypothetical protein